MECTFFKLLPAGIFEVKRDGIKVSELKKSSYISTVKENIITICDIGARWYYFQLSVAV